MHRFVYESGVVLYRKSFLPSGALMFGLNTMSPVALTEDNRCVTGPCEGHTNDEGMCPFPKCDEECPCMGEEE